MDTTINRSPLSQTQLGIFLDCMRRDVDSYHIPNLFRMGKNIDAERLAEALNKVISKHPVIYARIETDDDGNPVMYSDKNNFRRVKVEDISDAEFEALRHRLIEPFQIIGGNLSVIRVFRTESGVWLFTDYHHVISDGASQTGFLHSCDIAYRGEEPPEEGISGFEVAIREAEGRAGEEYNAAKRWYEEMFGGTDTEGKVYADVKGDKESYDSRRIFLPLASDELKGGAPLCYAAMGVVLGAFMHKNEVAYTTVTHGRKGRATDHTFCMMVKTQPVRCVMEKGMTIDGLVRKMKEQLIGCRRNDLFSFAEVAALTGITSEILFAYQGHFLDIPQIGGEPVVREKLETVSTGIPLNLELLQDDTHTWIDAEWRSDLYSTELVHTLCHTFAHVLKQMITLPGDTPLDNLSLIDDKDKEAIHEMCIRKPLGYDMYRPIEECISSTAANQPDNTAIVFERERISYRDMEKYVSRVAAYLQGIGIKKGDTVGVMIRRSPLMAVYPLALMRLGAAYMPLDPEFPEERLSFMTGDAGVNVILTSNRLANDIMPGFAGRIIDITEIPDADASPAPVDGKLPDDPFVVLYTSGSTGKPKGVTLSRGNLLNFCHDYIDLVNLTPADHIPAYANFGFDAHMMDIYPTLMAGGELHILNEETRHDLDALHSYIEENAITVSFFTTQIAYQLATLYEFSTLRCMLTGGEKLPPLQSLPYPFYNVYGPTECSVLTTYYRAEGDIDGTLIGKPLPGYGLRITDSAMRELPAGVPGELVILGKGVGLGYLNRPDMNREKFITLDGERAYRTGDLCRLTPEGDINFLGRMDGMVKLRGLRIELGEIEAVATRHEAVKQFAAAVKNISGNEQLVGYYSVKDGFTLAEDELREQMSHGLTEFMIPSILVKLDSLPLTPNGKVDRKALKTPEITVSDELAAPENDNEREISQLVADIIGHSNFGVTTNLLTVGLTSLLAMRLVATIAKKRNVKIAAKTVMTNPTVRGLAEEIVRLTGNVAEEIAKPEIRKRKYYPLSENQRGVFIDWELNREALQYNVPQAITFSRDIDTERLADALRKVTAAHPALLARFVNHNGDIMQQRDDNRGINVGIVTLDKAPARDELQQMVKPFNLFEDALFRYTIMTHPEGTTLFLDFHHIVLDGVSLMVFMNDLRNAYNGDSPLTESYTAFDRAVDEQSLMMSQEGEDAGEWFKSLLEGYESTIYPHSAIPDSIVPGEMGRITLLIDGDKIDSFCTGNAITPSNYFLSAFMQLLHRLTRNERIAITTVNNGRDDVRLIDDVGMFVKTLPVVSDISVAKAKVTSPMEAASTIQQQFLTTRGFDFYPFTAIVEKYGIRPEIMYVYEGGISVDMENDTLAGTPVTLGLDTAKVPLTMLVFTPEEGKYELALEYDAGVYCRADMQRLISMMGTLSQNLADTPLLYGTGLTSAADVALLDMIRDGESGDCGYESYHGAMEAWADATPEATALIASDRSMTYAEFDLEANRIANGLIKRGVHHGDRVVVLLPRDSRLITTIYGIMKAGAAYIPCDPDYPAERIRLITEDSDARYIVTTASRRDVFPDKGIDVDELTASDISSRPGIKIAPDDLAYMIYTSGSTGRPKGVKIHHGAITNYLYAYRKDFYTSQGENEPKVNMLLVTISFDASQVDLGTSLTSGHTLVLANEEECKDAVMLADLMMRTGVDAFDATPSRLAAMLELPAFREAVSCCRLLNIGGEGFPQSLLKRLRVDAGFKGLIVNEYGPTETTVGSNHAILKLGEPVTAGRPFYNYREYIVDPWGAEVPVGVTGELYIAGKGVGKGYHNMPEKNAESFVQFNGEPAYRTGDLARWTPEGDVEIAGRIDNQVKLRGLRIELGEIESVATTFPGVKTAAADVRKINNVEHLCLWYETDGVDTDELKTHLASRLTEYMVPDSYNPLKSMPVTPNGKIDRRGLPQPIIEAGAEFVEPLPGKEADIAEAFRETLGLERVGALDDFFKIGGTSINAIKLVAILSGKGIEVSYKEIFTAKTPRGLAGISPVEDTPNKTAATVAGATPRGEYADILENNSPESVTEGEPLPIGDVLLTGATGFMGVHMLHRLITSGNGKITCMVRGRGDITGESRLRSLLFYYFGDTFDELWDTRLSVIDGDVTDKEAFRLLPDCEIDTVINCAANVKHFSAGDDIEKVNVESVRNLVELCKQRNARLIHVSTVSIAGESVDGVPDPATRLTERDFDLGQNLSNQYVKSKYDAEKIIFDAIKSDGLVAKIMRVGNLSARVSDGEFQINFRSNAFMGRLKAYLVLGCVPYSHLDSPCEFSPIDEVCHAIIKLASTPSRMIVFHPCNNHRIPLGDVLDILGRICASPIKEVEWHDFESRISKMMTEPNADITALQPLLAYQSSAGVTTSFIEYANEYTTQVLYRLGFKWNYTSWDYVERFIKSIVALDYFSTGDASL